MNNRNCMVELNEMQVDKGFIAINWIGQAGFLFKTPAGTLVCIDPYQSNSVEKYEGREARRMWHSSIKYEDLKADLVICTHDHLDHTDPETIPLIAAHCDAVFFGTEPVCSHFKRMKIPEERIMETATGKEHFFRDIKIKPVYAKHCRGSIGVILEMEGISIYITGDSEFCSQLLEVKAEKPDLLITCINGKWGNMNASEACRLAVELGVKTAIPMHYGLIPSNTVKPDDFVGMCTEKGIKCIVLEHENNYLLSKQSDGSIKIWQT